VALVKNIKGQRSGRLLVKRFAYINNHRACWECLCDCGNKIVVTGKNLRNGNTKSCGCLNIDKIRARSRAKLEGQRFGRLTVTKLSHIKNQRTYWECRCDCGNTTAVTADKLKSGHTRSCGCLHIEIVKRITGKANPAWKGGVTPENHLIRSSAKYKNWRSKVFERGNWTCQMCGKRGGRLEAHHKFPFSKFPRIRFKIANGLTLCKKCHNRVKWEEIFVSIGMKIVE